MENYKYMENLPTEILLYILTPLEPKYLAKCRQVCSRWKLIVGSISKNENLWRKHCMRDFNDIYRYAYYRRTPRLKWYYLYRGLFLWSKLNKAIGSRAQITIASSCADEIHDIQMLKDGIVSILNGECIKYYNVFTLRQTKRSISGSYIKHIENDEVLVALGYNLSLFIIRKVVNDFNVEVNQTANNVKSFILVENKVFYVTLRNEIFHCDLDNLDLHCELLRQINSNVVCLGYDNGKLNILTSERDIITILNKEIIYHCNIDNVDNLMHELKIFNFLENLDWRVYYQWIYILKHPIPKGPLRDISVVMIYGKTVFVGTTWGVLQIYHNPYINNKFDIFNSEPVKQYNFMYPEDCPVLTMSSIFQIDVIEGIDRHMVLVAMPKMIEILTLSHNYKIDESLTSCMT